MINHLRRNFFAQFALLSLGAITVFATVIALVLTEGDAEYFSLFQQHAEAMQAGEPITPEEPYSIASLTDNLRHHAWVDVAAISAGFGILYLALVSIVWSGWKTNRRHQHDLESANETLVHSDASVRKMADERASVAELGRIATSAPDIDDIYEIFASRVGSLVPFSMLSVNLIDQSDNSFTTRYVAGDQISHHLQGTKMPITGTFVEPLQNGRSAVLFQPVNIEEVKDSFPSLAPGYNYGFRSYLGVALVSGNRRIGSLQWQSKAASAYSKSDFSLAEQIGSQIAGALANSQLHTDLERESRDREALANIGRIISSSLAIEDVYGRFAKSVRDLIPSDRVVINVIDTDAYTYKNVYLSGIEVANQGIGEQISLTGTQNEAVVSAKRYHLIQGDDVDGMLSEFPRLSDGLKAGLRAFLSVPLISNEQIIGTLNLRAYRPDAYTDHHVNLAERVSAQIAGAIANAHLHAQLDRESHEREALADIGRVISSSIDIDEVYERFAAHVSRVLPFDNLSISVVDQERDVSTVTYSSGSLQISERDPGDIYPLVGSLVGSVVHERSTVWINDVTSDQIESELPGLAPGYAAGIRSFLGVPLIHGDNLVAVLQVRSCEPRAYSDHHITLAERVGIQIAGAIANARLHADLEREAKERDVLAQIGRIISSSLVVEEVYERFADQAARIIPFDRISIANINPDQETSYVSYSSGLAVEGRTIGQMVPLNGSLLGEVARRRAPLLIQGFTRDDIAENYPFFLPGYDAGIRSSLSVPLIQADEVVSVLQFRSRDTQAYQKRDTVLAQSIGDQIAGALSNSRLFVERQVAQAALSEAEEKYRVLVENANDSIVLLRNGKIVYCNSAFETLLGYSSEEIAYLDFVNDVAPGFQEHDLEFDRLAMNGPEQHEIDLITQEGFRVSVVARPRIIEYQGQDATMIVMRDVSERKQLEEQLAQAQKLESVGKLAGGVAHDFNNLLSAILGFAQLAGNQLASAEPVSGNYLKQITTAAERGAGLVRQLLAFSRRQITAPIVLSTNEQIVNLDKMLRRLIGEHVDLKLELSEDPGIVLVDPGQLDQVLINLAVNARDAMPAGGRLTIQTESVTFGPEAVILDPELSPGEYVRISVSDDGIGMTSDVAARAFEPFFTTKGVGEGTGLGLSTCYGILKQNHGHITLESRLGEGSTFKLYIPKSVALPEAPAEIETPYDLLGGSETVLLVEDDEAVREITVEALNIQGYRVLEASNGEEAIKIIDSCKLEHIDLLLTDVVMPIMGGRELAGWYRASFPEGKVIYMSGYSDDLVAAREISGPDGNFMQKPVSLSELSNKVRHALDG
ncbi:MAG: GAF domain-containing protein [SAR202 cluster bacterium]|nr:GAF domain-containing protein [SAR202 cluster bacterium]MDP6713167.1 GAF domain-containing protein [SAR202 cluster bacterium]